MRYLVYCTVEEATVSSGEYADQLQTFDGLVDSTDLDAVFVEFRDLITEDRAKDYSTNQGEIWTVAAYALTDQFDIALDGITPLQPIELEPVASFSKSFTL